MNLNRNYRLIGFLVSAVLLYVVSTGILSAQADSARVDSSRIEISTDVPLDAARPSLPAPASEFRFKASGGAAAALGSGQIGATVGGAQDIGYARTLIDQGRVPNFISFSPEGLYSEHDIPTPDSECDQKLCLSLGYGFAPAADTRSSALFVHLGMTSGITPEDFQRPDLQLSLVIDRSGSMRGEKIEAVKTALRALVGKLSDSDNISIILFNNDAELILPPTPANESARILQAINNLSADGGTNIEAGMRLGFAELSNLEDRVGTQKRLMLFTDARPNIGRTDSGSFRTLTDEYADRGIGLTAFGVGLDFGNDLVYHISQLRGGNFFFLETPEKIATVFNEEFEYLVTPVVYDLTVNIKTPDGLKLTNVYGLPTWDSGQVDASLEVPTVFFSSNRGAIVLRYEPEEEVDFNIQQGQLISTGSLGYTDIDGRRISSSVAVRHEARTVLRPGVQFYTHEGIRTAVALTNVFFGLRDACRLFAEDKKEDAFAAIRRARGLVNLENATLLDAGLDEEIALLTRLEENIREADPDDDAYPESREIRPAK